MYGRWQIDTLVEPLSEQPEALHGDVFQRETARPDALFAARRISSASLLASAPTLFFTNIFPAPPEPITQDKWAQPQVQPYPRRTPPTREGWDCTDAQQLTAPEFAHVDSWMYRLEQPYPYRGKSFWAGWSITDTIALTRAEVPHLAAFMRPLSQPYPYRRLPAREGWSVTDAQKLTQPEFISLDKWWRPTSHTLWAVKPLLQVGDQIITLPIPAPPSETITLDKWWQAPQLPTLPPARLLANGLSALNFYPLPAPIVSALSGVGPNIIYELLFQYQQLAQAPFQPAAPPALALDWTQPTAQPYPTRRQLPTLGWYTIDSRQLTQAERTQLDKWARPIEQPRFDLARRQFLYPSWRGERLMVVPGEVVTLDKWDSRVTQPYPARRRLADALYHIIDRRQLTQPERTSLDKWAQPMEQPYPLRRTMPRLGLSVLDSRALLIEPNLLSKWFRATEQPLLRLRRAQGDGVLAPFQPLPPTPVFLDWMGQPPATINRPIPLSWPDLYRTPFILPITPPAPGIGRIILLDLLSGFIDVIALPTGRIILSDTLVTKIVDGI